MTDIATVEGRESLINAVITLYDTTTGELSGQFAYVGGNEWRLDYTAIPEHSYQLRIIIPGREEISATTTMPARSKIVCCGVPAYSPPVPFLNDEEDVIIDKRIELGVQYEIRSLPEGPVWVMGLDYNSNTGEYDVADLIATSLKTVDPYNQTGSLFHKADFFSISLLEQLSLNYGNAGFYQYVEGHPLYDKMLRIPPSREVERVSDDAPLLHINNVYPDHYDGYYLDCFSVAGSFKTKYQSDVRYNYDSFTEDDEVVLFMTPSDEYDRYLREVISRKTTNYASLYSRENVYTNVRNGIGIFGGQTQQTVPWNDYIIEEFLYY